MTLHVPTPADLHTFVGAILGPTDWVRIEQDQIDRFADATGQPAGGAAPGYLALSLVNLLLPELVVVDEFSMGVNVGLVQARFGPLVPAGQSIRGTGEIISVEPRGGGIQVIVRVSIEADGVAEPACVTDTISRFFP
jgi:acyl dehydratase